ncbi:MAG: 2'-5' RNA ligase family protein [Bacteroidales bacterium]|nr:2'-5' RNA ligase family protein [Bacteroidales bacterium]
MQIPVKRNSTDKARLAEALRGFAATEHPVTVDLNGYGAFPPRVIFIKIIQPGPVMELHSRLKKVLLEELHFDQDEVMKTVQPHMTVATRDLTKASFSEAWAEFEEKEFSASFDVGSIFLLKHNGRSWDIFEEFPFRENG